LKNIKDIIDKIYKEHNSNYEDLSIVLNNISFETSEYLFEKAQKVSTSIFGKKVYVRGLIEFTNYCKNNCFYCGIRSGNKNVDRYRLTKEDILSCCKNGYDLGMRTFVLQGGEDNYYTDEIMVDIISSIRKNYEDCAITLSLGERTKETYQKYFDAGANRFLLRHETINSEHYQKLHPESLNIQNRVQCLYNLKEIGFQVGTGFMVGSPYQKIENIVEDILFIKKFSPQMIGLGPFIPHKDTIFKDEASGSVDLTLVILALVRLMNPNALIPATTALGTVDKMGREKGILAGANVLMPNLSPVRVREKYLLYDNKICTGEEAAECKYCLENRIKKIGYELVVDRGDFGI